MAETTFASQPTDDLSGSAAVTLETNIAAAQLQAQLADVMAVSQMRMEAGAEPTYVFLGRLLRDPEAALSVLLDRFHTLGYTPLIRRQGQWDVVVALQGVIGASKSRAWINLALFVATVVTTTLAGALLVGANPLRNPLSLLSGLPFAVTLLTILGVHEFGHYFMARWHGMQVTLPYFIPVPPPFIGTLGAMVIMKSPTRNRRALFDVGLGGPIAGFVVALPLLFIGLALSEVERGAATLGKPLIVQVLIDLIHPHDPGYAVALHPVALAAYFGILITGLNLIPAGQFDGGHIAYAALGSAARPLAIVALMTMVLMGVFLWQGWLIWALLAFFSGLRHPTPLNDITELDPARRVIALGALLLFLITFVPNPF